MSTQTTTPTPLLDARHGALVSHAIRRYMADPEWAWRSTRTPAADVAEACALALLREDAARARQWLSQASAAIGLALPVGNGTNGPWQRIAVVGRDDGRLGILDIAAGRLAITDTVVPSYVRRFAGRPGAAVSPHPAGGTGAGEAGWSQVALTYGLWGERAVRTVRPHPVVTEIVYGLSTCYGTIGDPTTPDDYRREWAALAAVTQRATTTPQAEDWAPGGQMALDVAAELLRCSRYISCSVAVIEGGRHYAGCRGRARYRLTGSSEQRELAKRRIREAYPIYASWRLARAAAEARVALGDERPGDHDQVRLRILPVVR